MLAAPMENGTKSLAARVEKVRAAFASGKTRPLAYRRQQLMALRRLVTENLGAFTEAMHKDLRKCEVEAQLAEASLVTHEIDEALAHLTKWAAPQTVYTNPLNLPGKSQVIPEPYGLALVVGCWNYPLQLTLMPVATAIAAGNAVVVKTGSEEHSPATAALIAALVPKYMDNDTCIVVQGDYTVLQELLTLRYDVIMATGSPSLGRMVAQAAAPHLTPVILELGGKSPAYVHKSTDLEVAARRIAWSAYANAGQTCIRTDHVFVDKEVAEGFMAALARVTKEMYGEKPHESAYYGRLAHERAVQRLKSMVDKDRKHLVWGGDTDEKDCFMAPALLDFKEDSEAFQSAATMQDEIFGPIIPVLRVDGPAPVIKSILSREKPLALYVFTTDKRIQQRFVEETSSGALVFNDCIVHVTNSALPFGGVGNSGMGAYHGKFGFDAFSHAKPVLTRSTALDVSARYPPYTEGKRKVMNAVVGYVPSPVVAFLNIILSPATWAISAVTGAAALMYARPAIAARPASAAARK